MSLLYNFSSNYQWCIKHYNQVQMYQVSMRPRIKLMCVGVLVCVVHKLISRSNQQITNNKDPTDRVHAVGWSHIFLPFCDYENSYDNGCDPLPLSICIAMQMVLHGISLCHFSLKLIEYSCALNRTHPIPIYYMVTNKRTSVHKCAQSLGCLRIHR